jgi:hypothetical protein
VRTSRVRVFILLDGFRVRENFSRARFHPIEQVSRSREILAYTVSSFWTGFAFVRVSRVHGFILLDRLRVREFSLPILERTPCHKGLLVSNSISPKKHAINYLLIAS